MTAAIRPSSASIRIGTRGSRVEKVTAAIASSRSWSGRPKRSAQPYCDTRGKRDNALLSRGDRTKLRLRQEFADARLEFLCKGRGHGVRTILDVVADDDADGANMGIDECRRAHRPGGVQKTAQGRRNTLDKREFERPGLAAQIVTRAEKIALPLGGRIRDERVAGGDEHLHVRRDPVAELGLERRQRFFGTLDRRHIEGCPGTSDLLLK